MTRVNVQTFEDQNDAASTGHVFIRDTASVNGGAWGPAGGGGFSPTLVEIDLGAAKYRGRFTITDAGISASSKLLVWQAPGPYTGKGTRADEAELSLVNVTSVIPSSGSALVNWETPTFVGYRTRKNESVRINKVKGNVKFYYVIGS